MADEDGTSSASQSQHRRSSFTAQTLSGLFGGARARDSRGSVGDYDTNSSQPGPITTAATNARNRRLSLSTLGLSSSPEAMSRFAALRNQRDSLGSSPGSIDESAVEDDVGPRESNSPGTSFQRRASFGARAFMDVRNSGNMANVAAAGQNGTRSPSTSISRASHATISSRDAQGRGLSYSARRHSQQPVRLYARESLADFVLPGEGFNWSENLRNRAERSSIASASATDRSQNFHARAKSVAVMEPAVAELPRTSTRPDHFQERILKGDFYMD